MKPDDRRIPLDPGQHMVILDDVVSGVSDKTGNTYWIIKMVTENGVQFDHFIQTEETEYKTMDKVFKSAAEQMESLYLYDTIGEQPDFTSWFEKAIDLTYQLKGKKIEYTVSEWNINGKKGTWGKITGFLDMPNEAIQKVPAQAASAGPKPSFDSKEEIPF